MVRGYNVHLPHIRTYPGDGYYYVLCDICKKKIRRKDAVPIDDKFNLQNKLLVCKEDADLPNPLIRPYKAREYKAPILVRPDQLDFLQTTSGSIVPSAPQDLIAKRNLLSGTITLEWQGPLNGGDSPITGYAIYQSVPQLGPQTLVNSNTLGTTTYEDIYSDPNGIYTYWVAAVNYAGIGAISNPAFYPTMNVSYDVVYLATNGQVLADGAPNFLTIFNGS